MVQARASFGPVFDGRQQDELRVYHVHFLIHVVSNSVFGNSRSHAVTNDACGDEPKVNLVQLAVTT